MSTCLRILMSQQSIDRLGTSVSAAMGQRPYALISLEEAVAAQRTDADVAFMIRELHRRTAKRAHRKVGDVRRNGFSI
jgi:hypothetical protein